ncbi:MAG: hypothetical protein QXQ66_08710 [Candidatus Hadarchaeum sp.]|uniref:hypothetical protein n=1 Tax=Candidatus Hadarchaeum sp. TaxID=2883567 RepID=UPI00317D105B
MKPVDCSFYSRCECPLCPLENNPLAIWYTEDPVCKNPEFPIIINVMKKLKKKQAEGFFTLRMLSRDFVVRKGIQGIDPDLPSSIKNPEKEYQRREELWLKRHPELSEEKKKKMRERGKKSLGFIQKPLSRPSIFEMNDSKRVITGPGVDILQKTDEKGGNVR